MKNYLIILLVLMANICFATKKDTVSAASSPALSLTKADKAFAAHQYGNAIVSYNKAWLASPSNANLNFKLALCYHYLLVKPSLCTELFTNALRNTTATYNFYNDKLSKTSEDALYFLGKSYMNRNEMDSAITYLAKYQNKLKENTPLDAGRQLMMCVNYKQFVNQPRQLKVTSLGNSINSNSSDQNPVLSIDGKTLFFSSRRADKGQDSALFSDDDIYVSTNVNGSWTTPTPFEFNTEKDEEPLFLSLEGKKLYIRKETKQGGDIYISELQDTKWSSPQKMKGNANSEWDENGISFSADGNTMVVSSNRSGSLGGYDLYIATQKGGKWSALKNMGKAVNTELDEVLPHMHPTENRIYYSTNGNTEFGMGGYDILFTQRDSSGRWSSPFTMGYPVNTGSNEMGYSITAEGKNYYTTLNEEGDFDLYGIEAGEFEKKIEEKITNVTGTESVTEVQLLEVEKEKRVEVEKEVEISKIQEVEKEVEKEVGFVNAEEAKKLGKVVEIREKEVMVESVPTEIPADTKENSSNNSISYNTNSSTPKIVEDLTNANNENSFKTVKPLATENKSILKPKVHLVKAGEKLNEIAAQHDITMLDIKEWNKLNSSDLKSGTYLIVGYEYNNEVKDVLAMEQLKLAGVGANEREAIIENIKKYYADKMMGNNSTIFKSIYFGFNSKSPILSTAELEVLIGFLKEHKDVNLEVIGHTDNVGLWESNFWISRERGRSIYEYLMAKGISKSRLIFNGKGSTEPIESNFTLEGRAKNRRVEIKLIK